MIEFTCLSCGKRIAADDDDAGEQVECPACGIPLRVPTPIGGRLTEKRLAAAAPPPASFTVEMDADGESTPEAEPRLQRPALPPEAPRHGFQIEYGLTGVFGRDQQERLDETLQSICDAVRDHMEGRPQSFTSCGLLIEVHRFEVQIGEIDLRLHVRGTLNGDAVSETIRTHSSPGGNTESVLMRGALGVALSNGLSALQRMLLPGAGLSRAYRRASRLAARDISRFLDGIARQSQLP